jgi:UDP-glucose 4-epimerase
MPRVVLVTGVSRLLGGRLAARLASDPDIEQIVGVDTAAPRDKARLGRTEFVRVDIRTGQIGAVLDSHGVDTILHIPSQPGWDLDPATRRAAREFNVIGSMQLLAAAQRSEQVRHVVLASATSIYGCDPLGPSVRDERLPPPAGQRPGAARDAVEIEGYLRGFARRRPDVEVTILRLADLLGPRIDTSLTRYLSLPVVPTCLGFDPRWQFLHVDDAVAALRLAAAGQLGGTVNVAGSGVLVASQVIRRLGRRALPMLPAAFPTVRRLTRGRIGPDLLADQLGFLRFGRVVYTARIEAALPELRSTAQALAAFGAA